MSKVRTGFSVRTGVPSVALFAVLAACGGAPDGDGAPPCDGPSGTLCLFMGTTGRPGLGHDGVPPHEVRLYLPQDLDFGPDGRPYVVDWNNHRIRTLDADGLVQTYIGTGELGIGAPGPVGDVRLNHPTHVAFGPTGDLFLAAWHNSKVLSVRKGGATVEVVCGTGARSYSGDGGPPLEAALDLPVATVHDSEGRLYIMDQANQRIRRIEDGIINTALGPPGDWLPDGTRRVCVANDNGQEVCDKVCKAEEADDGERCAAQTVPRPWGFAGDGGAARDLRIYLPFGQSAPPSGRMAMGPDDVLYIADTGNHVVRAVDLRREGEAGAVSTVAGTPPAEFSEDLLGGYGGDGGPATAALLNRPNDVAVAADGTLYIADTRNSCVRVVAPDGTIATLAGVCGTRGSDGLGGPASEALLDRPYGVAIGPEGHVYIADTHNQRIVVVRK